jgi:hypothetical protein
MDEQINQTKPYFNFVKNGEFKEGVPWILYSYFILCEIFVLKCLVMA